MTLSMEKSDRFGLAASAKARMRHLKVRVATALIVGAVLHFALGWWLAWVWSAVYIGTQLLEAWAAPRLLPHFENIGGRPQAFLVRAWRSKFVTLLRERAQRQTGEPTS